MSSAAPGGHAFISYVREDGARVDALESFLDAAGIRVWRDKNELWPGDDWKIEIRRAIQNGTLAFVACFSENSAAREKSYQNEELVLAAEEYRLRPPGRPWLFPVRFADAAVPEFDLGTGRTLDSLQRSDLFGDIREPELARLAASIRRVLPVDEAALAAPPVSSANPPRTASSSPSNGAVAVRLKQCSETRPETLSSMITRRSSPTRLGLRFLMRRSFQPRPTNYLT
jgi:hypothetical protein